MKKCYSCGKQIKNPIYRVMMGHVILNKFYCEECKNNGEIYYEE